MKNLGYQYTRVGQHTVAAQERLGSLGGRSISAGI